MEARLPPLRLVDTMPRPSFILLLLWVVLAGCGGETRDAAAPQAELAASETAANDASDPTTEIVATSAEPVHSQPLSAGERRRLQMISESIDDAIVQFDKTVRDCEPAGWASCVDAAWAVIVADLDWPPYYLQRLGTRSRECESLAYAARGVYGFNLGARQLDYGDPAEMGTATLRRDRLALVDTLRPVPSELRTAVASACR